MNMLNDLGDENNNDDYIKKGISLKIITPAFSSNELNELAMCVANENRTILKNKYYIFSKVIKILWVLTSILVIYNLANSRMFYALGQQLSAWIEQQRPQDLTTLQKLIYFSMSTIGYVFFCVGAMIAPFMLLQIPVKCLTYIWKKKGLLMEIIDNSQLLNYIVWLEQIEELVRVKDSLLYDGVFEKDNRLTYTFRQDGYLKQKSVKLGKFSHEICKPYLIDFSVLNNDIQELMKSFSNRCSRFENKLS